MRLPSTIFQLLTTLDKEEEEEEENSLMPEIKVGGVTIKSGGEVKVGGKVYAEDVVKVNEEVVSGTEVDPTSIGIKKPEGLSTDHIPGLKVGSPEWKTALKAKIAAAQQSVSEVTAPQTPLPEGAITFPDLVGGRKIVNGQEYSLLKDANGQPVRRGNNFVYIPRG